MRSKAQTKDEFPWNGQDFDERRFNSRYQMQRDELILQRMHAEFFSPVIFSCRRERSILPCGAWPFTYRARSGSEPRISSMRLKL